MKLSDSISMAVQNLWSRKRRTILNLIGIATACTMMLMTFAGTRGVAEGLAEVLNSADEAKKIYVYKVDSQTETDETKIDDIEGNMSDDRKQRILEGLNERLHWFSMDSLMTLDDLETLNDMEHIVEAISMSGSYGRYDVIEAVEPNYQPYLSTDENYSFPNEGDVSPVSLVGSSLEDRLLAGEMLQADDRAGVLMSEMTAYRMGYRDDKELENLIGKQLTLTFQNHQLRTSWILEAINDEALSGNILEQAELLGAFKALVDAMDETDLSERQKKVIAQAIKDVPQELKGSKNNQQGNDKQEFDAQTDAAESVPQNPADQTCVFQTTIRGIIHAEEESGGLLQFLKSVSNSSGSDLLIHPDLAIEIHRTLQKNEPEESGHVFYNAVLTVDHVTNLRLAIDQLKSDGYETQSAVDTIERINYQTDRIRFAISLVALLIMLITALTVFNAMVISVMERTPEFGIMKALGTNDRHVLSLMLCEGAMTGLIGAGIAVLVSLGLSGIIGYFVRRYVEQEIGEGYSQGIFSFSPLDMLWISLLALLVCTIAAAIPAWRASLMDPVVAMQKK